MIQRCSVVEQLYSTDTNYAVQIMHEPAVRGTV
jgi:hypothetical protein